jgi:hypothetical protein
MKRLVLVGLACGLAGCASAQATRTSANTVMIDAGAAPVCGSAGAARVAAKMAVIETVRAGFDRYIITGGAAQNNVTATQLPGQYNTVGTATYGRGFGSYQATTTYTPGPVIVGGSHDRQLGVVMFHNGEPGAENAIDARQELGPEWRELVRTGVRTCI